MRRMLQLLFKQSSFTLIFLQGKVGINTESPDESLTVIGNVQVTGQILQPSDRRLKTNIKKVSKLIINNLNLGQYNYYSVLRS